MKMPNSRYMSEISQIVKGVQLLARSQTFYEFRKIEDRVAASIQASFSSKDRIDERKQQQDKSGSTYPRDMFGWWLPEAPRDVVERAQIVMIGLKTFLSLVAKQQYPGFVGYTVPVQGNRTETESSDGNQMGTTIKIDRGSGLTDDEVRYLQKAAMEVGVGKTEVNLPAFPKNQNERDRRKTRHFYQPSLPSGYRLKLLDEDKMPENSRERRIPTSRLGRMASFGQLGISLAAGAAVEVTRRALNISSDASNTADRVIGSKNPFLTPANAEKIVNTLCRVRGAALKLGQMLSIQDADTFPPYLLDIFERVRNNADFMPLHQVYRQLKNSLGNDWREKFAIFEEKPFAAASIGQVHKAKLHDGRTVAIKVQYPGVADGIDSDINNLISILNIGGLFPKGMFLENFVMVARRELKLECDYRREARAINTFRSLLANDPNFYVPEVVDDLTTKEVLTTEYVKGIPVDKCLKEPQQVRDYIAGKFIELCLNEVFAWRFMQTDPNWSNFYFGTHPKTGEMTLILLDFGASRAYPKRFVDKYMRIIRAAYEHDTEKVLEYSREIGFLTGYESKIMEKAHCDSIMILGETLASSKPYDFSKQNVTRRIRKLVPIMLENRLTPPPEEVYSLHRKLSGSYLLATKLKATVACGPLFKRIYDNYTFGEEGSVDIDIDNTTSEDQQLNAAS
ncbi:hypothetical protein AB6A40_004261 [Gnathostoma spinigerum]|uniref:ABC1 atypical kinase-like domain-containing protein n=1 Tax=Gnathostoma spinigerum TaxID=75299 RepID=A0ABD6ELG0_9BILA